MYSVSDAFAAALQYHRAGDLHAADQLYGQILQAAPQHVDTLHLRGVIAHQQGRHDLAIEYIQRAISLDGQRSHFHNNLGEAYRALGRLPEAVACYQRALALDPSYPDPHNNLGIAWKDLGKWEEALAAFQRAVDLKPDFAEVHNNLGILWHDRGHLHEALAAYQRAIQLKPDYACAQNNLAILWHDMGEHDQAIAACQRALQLTPGDPIVYNTLGTTFRALGRLDDAVACLRRALELRPDYAEALNNLGLAWEKRGDLQEAAAAYQRALQFRPNFAEVQNNLGNVWFLRGELDQAAACYRRALDAKPDYADACSNMGLMRWTKGEFSDSLAWYERALARKHDHPGAHLNRAQQWLLFGDFARGWPEYEWRRKDSDYGSRQFAGLPWDGRPFAGQTLFLYAEQGMGDTLQFIRYAPLVKQRGGTVLVECQAPLVPLLSRSPGIDRVLARNGDPPPLDRHASLLSLPLILGTGLDSIPGKVPYVFADPDRVTRWRDVLGKLSGYRVGIAWQGNPRYRADRFRSIPLPEFAPLAGVPGVRLVSLQKGAGTEQCAAARDRVPVLQLEGLDEQGGAFTDTAAVMMSLDLVVTSDSAVAHLAGALGVPVWVALPQVPDWRWLLDRDDSPWYPTMRLFRQRPTRGWADVFARIAVALRARVDEAQTAAARPDHGFTRTRFAAGVPRVPAQTAASGRPESPPSAAWNQRAHLAADLLPAGSQVMDLGGGGRALEKLLPFGATYVPVDVVARDERTIVCDFGKGELPKPADGAVLTALGVLENVADLPAFLQALRAFGKPAVVSYRSAHARGEERLLELIADAGLFVQAQIPVDAGEKLYRLVAARRPLSAQPRVLALSFLNVGNFGDRLGYHVLNGVLPPQALLHHGYFDASQGHKPTNVPAGEFDLLVLGIGNSLFGPLLTDELTAVMQRAKRVVGIFGTQYREQIDRRRLDQVLERLDVWFARYEGDLLLYGKACRKAIHLGDWLIDAFPMAVGSREDTLRIGNEIWQQLPLDRTIQKIQSYRRVHSTRLHPLLCALTSAEEVAYRKEREMGPGFTAGKFRSLLIDIFGRTYPEDQFFQVDRPAVLAYKQRVRAMMPQVARTLAELLEPQAASVRPLAAAGTNGNVRRI